MAGIRFVRASRSAIAPLGHRYDRASGRRRGPMPSMSGVQRACKPGSVAKTGQARSPDGHSSGPGVAPWFSRPTTAAARKPALSRRGRNTLRYLGLLRVGFTCRFHCWSRGALLPHPFTLTTGTEAPGAVCFLWHCPWARARRGLPGTLFPWSPDFPHQPRGVSATIRPSAGASPRPSAGRCKGLSAGRKLH